MFSQAQYEAVITSLEGGLGNLSTQLAKIGPAANAACSVPIMPSWVADGIRWCAEQLIDIGKAVLKKIGQLVRDGATGARTVARLADDGLELAAVFRAQHLGHHLAAHQFAQLLGGW